MLLAITLLLVSIPILSGLLGKKSSEPPAVTPVSKEEVPA